jgi:pimeloyl-ACP methyl ester carboxylesterase
MKPAHRDEPPATTTYTPRRHRRSRWLVIAAALAVAASTGVVTSLPSAEATITQRASTIEWEKCPALAEGQARDPRQTCGTLRVPLDYRAPNGRTITVAVSRIPAAKPAQRRGVLLLNGGGPGPSLDVPSLLGPLLPASVVDRYDLVAFDPRGIAHSTPISCGRSAEELARDQELEVFSFPAGDGTIGRNVAYSRAMSKRCAAESGDLLPYVTTANVARDMDQIRLALGERRVSYYGLSWGTYLGAVYRALFPRNVERMVLDSSVDPNERGYDDFRTFAVAMDDRFPDLARFAIEHSDTVGFGTTQSRVRAKYLAVTAKLDRKPVTVPGSPAPLTGNLVRMFTVLLSYSDSNLPTLTQFWRAAADFANGSATSDEVTLVQQIANGLVANGTLPGVPQDNLFSVGWAISCGDARWPRDIRTYARNTAADRIAHPLTAGAPANVTPCSFWKFRPIEPPVGVSDVGVRNVLIVQNQRDPATPLITAQGMRKALGSGAALIDIDAGGHGVVIHPDQSSCAITALETFLTDGQLPAQDKSCPEA